MRGPNPAPSSLPTAPLSSPPPTPPPPCLSFQFLEIPRSSTVPPSGSPKTRRTGIHSPKPAEGASGLAPHARPALRMCPMRAAPSHATPPSHRLLLLDSDTTRAVGNFLNLARTRPLLPMLSPQISRSPGGTGVCLALLRALFVPRVPGRRAASGGRGRGGKGAARCGGGAGGAWRGARGGGLLGGARHLAHTRRVTLCRKMGVVWGRPLKEGEARLETPPSLGGKRSDSRAGGAPGRSPGRFPVALHAPGTFLKCV